MDLQEFKQHLQHFPRTASQRCSEASEFTLTLGQLGNYPGSFTRIASQILASLDHPITESGIPNFWISLCSRINRRLEENSGFKILNLQWMNTEIFWNAKSQSRFRRFSVGLILLNLATVSPFKSCGGLQNTCWDTTPEKRGACSPIAGISHRVLKLSALAALKYLWMIVMTARPSWETFKLLF